MTPLLHDELGLWGLAGWCVAASVALLRATLGGVL